MKLSSRKTEHIKRQYGKWAIITGASSGIGKALAERLAEAGLNLVISSRNLQKLEEIAANLTVKHNIQVIPVDADVSTNEGIEKIISASKNREVGLFIPSAGYGTSGDFINSSLQEEINMLRVNAEAVLSLTHYFSNLFVNQKRGGIIFLSSIVAFQGVPYASNYASTKAYIQSFAEALAIELKPHGVDILSVASAPVSSGFGKRANMNLGKAMKPDEITVPILNALGKKTNVLPGVLTKVLTYSLRTVPWWAKVRIMQKVMGGFTKHQR